MIGGIGIDLIEVARFKDVNTQFLNRVFTMAEITYCLSQSLPAEHFAARFAAKEAVIKALYDSGERTTFEEIEIIKRASGAPKVKFRGMVRDDIHITLTHTPQFASGVAIIEGKAHGTN